MNRAELDSWKPREVARLLSLVEAERRYYQEMMAALPVAAALVASDGLLSATNTRFREMFGLSRVDVASTSAAALLDREDVRALLQEALIGNAPPPLATIADLPGGGRKFLRFTAVPFEGWEGAGGEALLVVEDLDEARELVRRATRPYEDLLSNLDAAVWELDPSTMRFTSVNHRALELHGFPLQAWKEQEGFWLERVHPEDREWVRGFYQQAIAAGRSCSCEYRGLTVGGQAIALRDLLRFSPAGADRPVRMFGVTIETGGWRRSRLLAEQSSRMAAISRIAARVAHDGNNLLTILSGYSEELRQGLGPNASLRENLAEILAAGERLGNLTRPLADFTRPLPSEMRLFSVDAWLAGLEPLLRQDLAPAATAAPAVRFELRLRAGQAPVHGDPQRLAPALRSLVSRVAILAPPASWLMLRTDVERIAEASPEGHALPPPGSYVVVALQDNGPSLTQQERESFFEPLPASADPAHDFSGVWKAVTDCGGYILVTAPEQGGSLFTLYFPCRMEQEQPAPPPETPSPRPMPTVLVVDDEQGIRSLMRKILERHGFRVLEAADGEEALRVAGALSEPLNLLITDVVMPVMGGVELAERLLAQRPDLPILFISGYLGDAGLHLAKFPQGAEFLQKPFTLNALMERVNRILGPR